MSCSRNPSVAVEVKLSRSDRVYHAGDDLLGEVVVTCGPGGVQHSGIRVCATGSVSMRVSERAVGVFEAFFLNVRPIALLNETIEAAPAGTLPEGVSRLPFALPLRAPTENPNTKLHETYHGINISVQYGVAAEMERSIVRGGKLSTGLVEFIIEERGGKPEQDVCEASLPIEFVLTPDEEHTAADSASLRITGRVDHGTVAIQRPVSGWIKVERCTAPLRSIELTLGRVEWCTVGDHSNSIAREATDIQCTQVGDGHVVHGLELPIHLVLPRLYTCPTVDADTWGVEFELSVVATLDGGGSEGAYVTASTRMPLRLVRGTRD